MTGTRLEIGFVNEYDEQCVVEIDTEQQQHLALITPNPQEPWRSPPEPCVLKPGIGLEGPRSIDMIVKDGIVDVCIDRRYTLIARSPGSVGNHLCFTVYNGEALFEAIQVRPLIA